MSGSEIRVEHLTHRYRTGNGELTVLDDIGFTIESGGYAALTGASGAGKSTLLSLLGGLETPQDGTLSVGGIALNGLHSNALASYRRDTVGFVFQHFGLLDALTARENVELALMLARVAPAARRRRATELLGDVGLGHRTDHRAASLSGGERQRVAIARSVANEPSLVLADEPTGNLDEGSTEQVITMLEDLHRDRGCTLVIVTHSGPVAARAPQRLHLDGGRMAAVGEVTR